MKPESLIPILFSKDIHKSLAYYTEVLGFPDKWEWKDPPPFGGVNWGDVRVFFCEHNQEHPGSWICINVDNVDEYHSFILERGAEILSVPEDKPWFMREMIVRDPDGNIIRFGHSIECD